MTPLETWLSAALVAVASFTSYLVKRFFDHYESDINYSRRTNTRGVKVAEKITQDAEETLGG